MSDARDKSRGEAAAEEEAQGPTGGERLAAARREQQISVAEIAKELHLDDAKVRALESNEFDVIGAPVFAKGHLRKYAQLVGVDESDVMADYYQLNRTAGMPPLVSTRPRVHREMSPGPWIGVIVVLIAVATAYWWLTLPPAVDDEPPIDLVTAPATTEPTADDPAVDVGSDDSDVLRSVDDTEDGGGEDTEEDVEASPPQTADTPALSDGQMRILVTYSGDCWTEITDAGGRRLFFGLGTDGRTVELSGEAPFNVLFGDAENVRISVNGSDRAIAAAERRGRTARLTIAGS